MEKDLYYPVAYAAPMPEDTVPAYYKTQLETLIKAIEDLKGITTEVKKLKGLAASTPLDF